MMTTKSFNRTTAKGFPSTDVLGVKEHIHSQEETPPGLQSHQFTVNQEETPSGLQSHQFTVDLLVKS